MSYLVKSLSKIAYLPYHYWYGNQKAAPTELNEEGWENILTDKEKLEEQKNKVRAATDPIFFQSMDQSKVYSYETLKGCGKKDPEDRLLVPFKNFGPGANPYLRRSEMLPSIYNASDYYHKDLAERIIQQCMPDSVRGKSPMDYLSQKLQEKDPRALQVAALLFQIGDDSSCLPPEPANQENLTELVGQVHITPLEVGKVELNPDNLELTIEGDLNLVTFSNGELIRGYETKRTITVGYPNVEGSVECKIETVYKQHYDSVE